MVFDFNKFITYAEENYHGFSGTDGMFLRNTLNNVIEYAEKNLFKDRKDGLSRYLEEILPDMEFAEICQFIDDSALSQDSINQKRLWNSLYGETFGITI